MKKWFHWHSWSFWEDAGSALVPFPNGMQVPGKLQERHCKECGRVQRHVVGPATFREWQAEVAAAQAIALRGAR